MNFHADQTILSDKRPQQQLRADLQEVDVLDALRAVERGCLVTQSLADDQFGALLVEHSDARRRDNAGLSQLFQSLDEASQIAVDEAVLQ
ncbi:MAG: hypothetical protein FD138_1534, partial [Planctomycetota bacterium]